MSCEPCARERDLAALGQRLSALEKESERNQSAHKEFYSKLEDAGEARVRIDVQYSNILTKLEKVEAVVDELKAKPGKRWDSIVSSVLQWLLTAILAAATFLK